MRKNQRTETAENTHSIIYEIKKLNKLIVAEQSYSDVISHKNSIYLPYLGNLFSFDKKVLLLVDAKIQATYDLNKMDVKIDSAKKTIYILKIPELEIKTYPDIRFYDIEQSTFNTFNKDELNVIKEKSVEQINKKIDKKQLEKKAHQQLIENLHEIYLLAKAYNWKIVDETPYSGELEKQFY